MIRNIFILSLSTLIFCPSLKAETQPLTIIESKGIESIAVLGDPIENVFQIWGRKESDPEYKGYGYPEKGVLFDTDKEGKINRIVLYFNNAVNYGSFEGVTSKGLDFRERKTAEDIYTIYGSPKTELETHEAFPDGIKTLQTTGDPFMVKETPDSISIYYPKLNTYFHIYKGFVSSCHIGN